MQNARPGQGASVPVNSRDDAGPKNTATPAAPQEFWPRLASLPIRPRTFREASLRVTAARADLRDAERIARKVAIEATLARIGQAIDPHVQRDVIYALNERIAQARRDVINAQGRLDRAIARRNKMRCGRR